MGAVPESDQEAIVAAFTASSLGAPFIWEPAPYRKGSGTREPADLAWICRGTIFLINMKAGNAAAEKLHSGNLKQMRGWLRMWASGVPLRGSNDWQRFDESLQSVEQIVLLSVVQAKDATCSVARTPPIAGIPGSKLLFSAYLTPAILLFIAEHAGSACDLADFLLYLASHSEPMYESQALEHLSQVWQAGRDRALLDCEKDRDDEMDDVSFRTILRVGRLGQMDEVPDRSMKALITKITSENKENRAMFNDWDFETTYRLFYSASDVINRVRVPNETGLWESFAADVYFAEPYHFLLSATNSLARPQTWNQGFDKIDEVLERLMAAHPGQSIFVMNSLVKGPSAQDVTGFMCRFGGESPRITTYTLKAAAELVRTA